jgi:hypothetical protein
MRRGTRYRLTRKQYVYHEVSNCITISHSNANATTEHLSSPQVLCLVCKTSLSPAASSRPNALLRVPNESSASSPHAVPRPAITSTSSPHYPMPLRNSAPAQNTAVRIAMCLGFSLSGQQPQMLRPSLMACRTTLLAWPLCWEIRVQLPSMTCRLSVAVLRDGPAMISLTQSCSSTGRPSTSLIGITFLSRYSDIPFICTIFTETLWLEFHH